MNTDNLIKRFADAGQKLVIEKEPIIKGGIGAVAQANRETFQMDIKRRKSNDPHSEYFAVWPGHKDNLAVVQGIDKELSQLVLMVKEPKRKFFEPAPAHVIKHQKARHGAGWLKKFAEEHRVKLSDIVVSKGEYFVVRWATDRKRHFLMGRDERQIFMCQLPKACTTVQQAHDCLRAPTIQMFEGKAEGRTVRQGEWFFVNLSEAEKKELEAAIKSGKAIVRSKVNIGTIIPRAGKPHTADEGAVIRLEHPGVGRDAGGTIRDVRTAKTFEAGTNLFVKGAVRHSDHKTIKLAQWRRVVRNMERNDGQSVLGGRWID